MKYLMASSAEKRDVICDNASREISRYFSLHQYVATNNQYGQNIKSQKLLSSVTFSFTVRSDSINMPSEVS